MMRVLGILIMQLWLLGAFVLAILAVCRLIFIPKFGQFLGRLQLAVIWPLALVTRAGRKHLVQFYKEDE